MRFFLRFLVLPMLLTLSLQAPAQAQMIQLTSIHGVWPGMPLDEAIAALQEADYAFQTTDAGDIEFIDQTSDLYEGSPAYFRTAIATQASDGVVVTAHLMALRTPDAGGDDWKIAVIGRGQSFYASDLKPRFKDLYAQALERIGVDEATCADPDDKAEAVFIFDKDGYFVADAGDEEFCDSLQDAFQDGDFGAAILIDGRLSDEEKGRVDEFGISLMDGAMARTQMAIRNGTYGKVAPTLGDF